MIEEPYPLLIMLDLNWSPADITSKNSLIVLASLPALFFLPNIYELKNVYKLEIYQTIYKLKSLIFFTGNHYFTIMRVQSQLSPHTKCWHLFNDNQIEIF